MMPIETSDERDYFTDLSVLRDPYEYFESMFSKGPVRQMATRDVVMVTGFRESLEVLNNPKDFSSVISVPGAAYPLPFVPGGDDISGQIEAHRGEIPGNDLLVTYDDGRHSALRSIANKLFVPSRLKANEVYMRELADALVKGVVAKGKCELVSEIATPYVTLVIADLLGVPEGDRELFREAIDAAPPPGNMQDDDKPTAVSPLEYMAGFFVRYIQDRRASPTSDVLTQLATATYPDGSTPDLMEMVRLATFMFGAGQDTSAKLLCNAMCYIVDTPGLQKVLREDRALVAPFLEEALRLQGSTKGTFRVARRNTRIGEMEIPAGTKVMVALAAANRDPRRWQDPQEFRLNREKIKEHVAFGRGPHVCVGAPLARAEVGVILDRFLEHTSEIGLSEAEHGTPDNRRLDYEASFIIRGLSKLHLELKPN